MGMFDEVHFEDHVWQTKDFDCLMEHYFVTDGRLLKEEGHWEGGPMMGWHFVRDGASDINYHGLIRIYDIFDRPDKAYREWVEKELKFTNGQLVEVIDKSRDRL